MANACPNRLYALVAHAVFLNAVLAWLCAAASAAELRIEHDNTAIAANTSLAPATYQVTDADDNGVLHVRGDNIIVDFRGATLSGATGEQSPDQFRGRGIVIEDSANVVIKNARVRGFRLGLYARNCRNLIIEGCDFSDNFKQHLLSTPQAENAADWLFGHENDQNEWFRYGAGIYLDGCTGFTVRNNTVHRGQNGICLVCSHDGAVYDNDCSFNSGWGLALYRACRNTVSHNKLDWCIRGYSHGVYNRGQDSAGILVFEQCSGNVLAYNSATHGGDGFFLFAGNETLNETGEGGCNRNLVYGNDFSHASNNGIEATFSTQNRFIANIIDEADHAIWAGYSYDCQFIGNRISRASHGISIEHGSHNRIEANRFKGVGVAMNLWANAASAFADKPYGKHHSCRSEDYTIVKNRFDGDRLDLRIANTSQVVVRGNELIGAPLAIDLAGDVRKVGLEGNNISGELRLAKNADVRLERNYLQPPRREIASVDAPLALDFTPDTPAEAPDVPGSQDAFLPKGALRGLQYILVDEWGPYDFSQVKVSPEQPVFWGDGELRVLGPPTPFVVQDITGDVRVSPLQGELPATLKISADGKQMHRFAFSLKLPERREAIPVKGLLLYADWNVKFYAWQGAGPRKPPADWAAVVAGPVLEARRASKIDFSWGGGHPSERVANDYFATVSTAQIDLPAGKYELRTISDDGVRVLIDGQPAIDNWTWHPPTENTAEVTLTAGTHALRIEHFEIDGVAQLQFWLRPRY
ncbi:MAG TPA: right-handed parallel beta-helix repeat-containing protein [Pirellulales bacterium]|nr:right-handed parallel beta-helix repeat-containing protein [Pirellulales bacterium]